MRAILTTILVTTATAAAAHPGHIAESGGHTHALALAAALGAAAIAAALLVAPRVRRFIAHTRDRRRNAG